MGSKGLLTAMLRVGTIGFGGGAVLIPVIDEELVQRRRLLSSQQFGTHTLIANLTPGALPVKLAALAGAELGRPVMALAAGVAVALPGALATVILLASFHAIGAAGIRLVEFAAVGISVFIMVLLGHFIVKVIAKAADRQGWAIAIMAASFVATAGPLLVRAAGKLLGRDWQLGLPRLTAVQVIVVAIVAITVVHLLHPRPNPPSSGGGNRAAWHSAALFIGVLVAVLAAAVFWPAGARFLGLVGLSTATSFGGGEAYVAVADGFFVASGMVDPHVFYGQTVPVANALPGPILVKIASAVGFSFGMACGGWPLAVIFSLGAFMVAIAVSCVPAMMLLAGYAKVGRSLFIRRLGNYIMPVICGLLLTTSVAMVDANMNVAAAASVSVPAVGWATLVGVGVLWWLQTRFKLADLVLLGICGGCSVIALVVAAG